MFQNIAHKIYFEKKKNFTTSILKKNKITNNSKILISLKSIIDEKHLRIFCFI